MDLHGKRRIGIMICLSWLLAVTAGFQVSVASSTLRIGDPVPVFSLSRGDGVPGQYELEPLKGPPAVILFWRPQQELSLEALRDLGMVAAELGTERIRIVGVDSARSSAQEVQAALGGGDVSFPILLDPQRELYGRFAVIVSPTTFLVDAEGVLRFKVASHARHYSRIITARLRFLLGDIDEEQMNQEIEPTVLKIDHDLAAALRMYNLGRKLQGEGKPQEAVAMYEKAVSQYPSLPEARCALGFMRLTSGDLDAAAQHFQTALTYQPDAPLARLGQAAVLARTGQSRQAEQILLALLGRTSIAIRVRYELGRIYYSRGEEKLAATFFQDALSGIFPEPKPASEGEMPRLAVSAPSPSDAAVEGASAVKPLTRTASRQTEAVQAVMPPADAEYLGFKTCKKCHFQQWKSWQDTKMASSFEALRPGSAADVKASRHLDAEKDYTADSECLACHTTGFGFPGGYQIPAPGDSAAERVALENAGVACESCHGPGNKYHHIHKDIQDSQRQYRRSELYDAGQFRVDVRVCAMCHTESAPCIESGYLFDFQTRKDEGTHRHYNLKFLSR
ncbi:MAG: multiheme c-type cytochrome [Planctomycetota bacterium]|jgi:tetratricopeptide (TPR) repeat protein